VNSHDTLNERSWNDTSSARATRKSEIHASGTYVAGRPKHRETEEPNLMQTISDCSWGFNSFDVAGFQDSLAITEMKRKVCNFRWRTSNSMIEELEGLKSCGGQALARADLDDSIMYYEAAQHMVSFFLHTGEIVRIFGLDNNSQRKSRFM